MKKTKTIYWISTILFTGIMLLSAIPDILMTEEAVEYISKLGFPNYLIPFLGWAKLLGAIAILVPGFPRVTEWAYAGLFIDLVGATYAGIVVFGFGTDLIFMVLPFTTGIFSYCYKHKLLQAK